MTAANDPQDRVDDEFDPDDSPDLCLVTTTFANMEDAKAIAHALVSEHLAACVQLVPGATSIYHWEGAVHEETEILATIKTAEGLLPEILGVIEDRHSYDTPEFLVLPIEAGSPSYIEWMASRLRSPIEIDEAAD